MAPALASALISGIPGAFKTGVGLWQGIKGKGLGKDRPTYTIPGAETEALELAKTIGGQGLPGYDIRKEEILSGTAGAVGDLLDVSQTPGQVSSNVAKIYESSVGKTKELEIADAEAELRNKGILQQALQRYGQLQEKEFAYNEDQPYREAALASAMLKEGGLTNISKGLGGLARAGMGAVDPDRYSPGNYGSQGYGYPGNYGYGGASYGFPGTPNQPIDTSTDTSGSNFFNDVLYG